MNNRRILLLLSLLAALSGVAWLLSRQAGPPAGAQAEPFLPGLAAALNALEEVVVIGPGERVIATLKRQADGWTVAEADGYPADIGRLRGLLLALSRARIVETKTARPELHARLGVEDLSLEDASGIKLVLRSPAYSASVIIGETGVAGGMSYVRRADENQAYLVDQQLDTGETLRDWLDRRVLDIPASEIRRVTIEHPDGETLVIEKSDPQASDFQVLDIPEGRKLAYPGVANAIGAALSGLQFESVMPATELATPAAPPVLTRFETFDGLTIDARSWRVEDGHLVAFSVSATAPPPMPPAAADGAETPATDATAPHSAEDSGATAPHSAEDSGATALHSAEDSGATAPHSAAEVSTGPDPVARAVELNHRLGGWLYRLPDYKTDQLIRRMNDLLEAES